MSILLLVPVALAKHPHKRNVREKGHSSRTQSILVGKSTWQEPETVVYIMPMTQKQRKGNSSIQHTSLFIQSRIPVREWSLHSRWYFPTQSTWYNSPPWLRWFQIFSDWQLRDSVWTQHLPNCPFHCFNSGRTRTSEDLLIKVALLFPDVLQDLHVSLHILESFEDEILCLSRRQREESLGHWM